MLLLSAALAAPPSAVRPTRLLRRPIDADAARAEDVHAGEREEHESNIPAMVPPTDLIAAMRVR